MTKLVLRSHILFVSRSFLMWKNMLHCNYYRFFLSVQSFNCSITALNKNIVSLLPAYFEDTCWSHRFHIRVSYVQKLYFHKISRWSNFCQHTNVHFAFQQRWPTASSVTSPNFYSVPLCGAAALLTVNKRSGRTGEKRNFETGEFILQSLPEKYSMWCIELFKPFIEWQQFHSSHLKLVSNRWDELLTSESESVSLGLDFDLTLAA